MSEKTPVRLHQLAIEVSYSAGYIRGVMSLGITVILPNGGEHRYHSAIVTQLGIIPVDETVDVVMAHWVQALKAPEDQPSPRTLGNNAEF